MGQFRKANTKASKIEREVERIQLALKSRKIRVASEMKSHDAPCKKYTKHASKAAPNSFNTNLKGVPGGDRRGGFNIVAAIAAEHTGTRVATAPEEKRLVNSARNCDTTTFRSGR